MAANNTHTHSKGKDFHTRAYLTVNSVCATPIRMRMREIVAKIQRTTGENQDKLARRLGVSQPTVSRWISGQDAPTGEKRDLILNEARSLGVIQDKDSAMSPSVPIVGYVGAGGAVLFSEGQGPFGEADMPPGGSSVHTVAVVVRGDSMAGQLEDGWTVYYDNRQEPPVPELYHKLCVVGLTDGRVLIKKLLPGRQAGKYDLYSANASPLLDAEIAWAAKVTWIAPV